MTKEEILSEESGLLLATIHEAYPWAIKAMEAYALQESERAFYAASKDKIYKEMDSFEKEYYQKGLTIYRFNYFADYQSKINKQQEK